MSKNRFINTLFWRDNYINNLDPSEKLLFLYFLTNPDTNICGVYQIPLKTIAVDTGFDKEMILKILERFTSDNKMIYSDGWIAIKNFIKNQNQNSPKVKKGIEIELEKCPEMLKKYVMDRLSKGIDTLSHSNSNSNSNSNSSKSHCNSDELPLADKKKKKEPKIYFGKYKANEMTNKYISWFEEICGQYPECFAYDWKAFWKIISSMEKDYTVNYQDNIDQLFIDILENSKNINSLYEKTCNIWKQLPRPSIIYKYINEIKQYIKLKINKEARNGN